MELNKRSVPAGHGWTNILTSQLFTRNCPFYPHVSVFPQWFLSKIPPFPCTWLLPWEGKSCAAAESFSAVSGVFSTPRKQPPSVQSLAWCWPVLLAFTPGNWCWGCPGTGCPFLWVLNLSSHLLVCHCASLDLLRWVFDGLMGPVMSLGVARVRCYLGLPHLLLSFLFECASELLLDNLAESHLISCHLVILQLVSSDVRHPW